MLLVIIISFTIAELNAQSSICLDGGVGPCLGTMCPAADLTCMPDGTCCNNSMIGVPTTTTVSTTTISTTSAASTGSSGAPATVPTGSTPSSAVPTGSTISTLSTAPPTVPTGTTTTSPTTQPPTTTPPCVDLSTQCSSMIAYCNNALYFDLMTTNCPVTCGRCNYVPTTTAAIPVTTAPSCVDQTTQCPSVSAYCNVASYFTLMTQQCPRTCGRCGYVAPTTIPPTTTASSVCVDKLNPNTGTSDCPGMASYCNAPMYVSLMKEQCPKTCAYCAAPACADLINPKTGTSDCPGMASYCSNSLYLQLMQQQCPHTCGYC